jgi:hypothetical protein
VAVVMSFLGRVFIERNVAGELVGELDDELYGLNQRLGEERFPRTAAEYLDDWAAPERGWLRKFYPPDLTRRFSTETSSRLAARTFAT